MYANLSVNELIEKFPTIIQEIEVLYNREKLFAAAEQLKNLKEALNNIIKSDDAVKIQNILESLSSNEILENVEVESVEAKRIMHEIESEEGWQLCTDKDEIQTFYRREENEKLHAIKIQGTIDSPMFNVLSIFYEIDLYKTWMPRMTDSRILKQYGRYRFLCYYNFNMPWPFYDRDLVSYGYGIDLMEKNTILVVVRSVPTNAEEKYHSVEFPEADTPTCARMHLGYAGFMIRPISPTQTYVSLIGSCDPKFSYIPGWFMNMVTHQMSYLILQKLRSVAADIPGSEYEIRINKNKHVYGDIMDRLNNYFQQKETEDSSYQNMIS
jgi:hypothetical protein